jgi:hypothetical protein
LKKGYKKLLETLDRKENLPENAYIFDEIPKLNDSPFKNLYE